MALDAHTGAVLAIDLGTSGPKVGLVSRDGEVVGTAFEPVPLLLEPGGGAEQRPGDWWAAIVDRRPPRAGGLPGRARRGARGRRSPRQWAGHRGGRRGRACRCAAAVIWLDTRGASHGGGSPAAGVRVAGYDPRKLALWVRRTGGAPSLSGRDPLGHILWLRAERPEVYRAAARLPRAGRLAGVQALRPDRDDERHRNAALGHRHARRVAGALRRRPAARWPGCGAISCPSCSAPTRCSAR